MPLIRFTESIGTNASNALVGAAQTVTYGLGGNDTLTSTAAEEEIFLYGGLGNDIYNVGISSTTIISDLGGTADRVTVPFSLAANVVSATLDGKHLVVYEDGGSLTGVIFVNWLNSPNAIETMEFSGGSFSSETLMPALVAQTNFLGNISLEEDQSGVISEVFTAAEIREALKFHTQREAEIREDIVVGGGGGGFDLDDFFVGGDGQDTFYGLTGRDTLQGGSGADELFGGADVDEIIGNAGNDLLSGGSSGDFLKGNLGNDTVRGGRDNDTVNGNTGDDLVFGDIGNDTVRGGKDNDVVNGNAGNDVVFGDAGNDIALGGKDDDTVNGSAGDDAVNGNLGNDSVRGGQGNDVVHGGQGNDIVRGDVGNDQIFGDLGNDTLSGGDGLDTFVFVANSGADVIEDFASGLDVIGLSSNLHASAASAVAAFNNGVLDLGGGNTVTLTGVNALVEADIVIF